MESEEKLPGPVLLDVVPVGCSMTMQRSCDPERPSRNSLSMRLRVLDEIETPDGRRIDEAEWWMAFYENGTDNELTELHSAVGLINYYAAWDSAEHSSPESCHAWANVDSETFVLLRDMASAGKLPSGLRLQVYGMNYGWAPDGSEKVWDVKAHKNIPITEISIDASFVKAPEFVQEADEGKAFIATPPAPERPELAAVLAATKVIQQVHERLGLAVGLLAIFIAVVIFK